MRKLFIFMTSLLAVAAMSVSCEENETLGGSNGLSVLFDKNVIRADGSDLVTFKAYYDGKDITSDPDAMLFRATGVKEQGGELVATDLELVTNWNFAASKAGAYYFQVAYRSAYTSMIVINAIDAEVPAAVADSDPLNTSFVHRAFLNQHTGAQCGFCPLMAKLLRETFALEGMDDVAVLASIRDYNSAEAGFARIDRVPREWPFLEIDYSDSYSSTDPAEGLFAKAKAISATPAQAAISANPVYVSDTKQIIIKAAVKAAETAEYNLGLWLMQDNYYKTQKDETGVIGSDKTYHYHDNCVRIAESQYLGRHVGYPLGTIQAGTTAEWTFVFNVNESWWAKQSGGVQLSDLRIAAFVTTPVKTDTGKTVYKVLNAIQFPYNQAKPFEYKK